MPPMPMPKPPRADEVLAAVAARYRPGEPVSLGMVSLASGVREREAGSIRSWARSAGLWVWADGRARWRNWRGHRAVAGGS